MKVNEEQDERQHRRATKGIVGFDSHLKKIAVDFVAHFEERLSVMEGKAMIV